ncbi:unnamed protein product [Amaranthus hypochondriacus]
MPPSTQALSMENCEQSTQNLHQSILAEIQTLTQTFDQKFNALMAMLQKTQEQTTKFQEEFRGLLKPDSKTLPESNHVNPQQTATTDNRDRLYSIVRCELPVFNGDNPIDWIFKAERFFKFYRLTEEDKVNAAIINLDGDAMYFIQFENKIRPITQWSELKSLILRHFRPVSAGTLCEEWFGLSQEGTVKEYTRKFVELLLLMEDLQISDELMLANFKKGLEEEIKIELEMLWPETLDQAMDMAVRIEAKLKGQLG